jgi:predicted RNA binding protein YcfA (HicA-like mRNA interferase family)
MSDKIPSVSSKKFIHLLQKSGAKFVRQRGTSHAIYERKVRNIIYRAPVITAKKDLSPKYIKLVLTQLGYSEEEINSIFK